MVDDKWIGLALAVSGSAAIGASSIITKKGLNASADASYGGAAASDNMNYLKNPVWWAGMTTLVLGETANFLAYIFAPPILVTPLGALSVLIGAILASFLLKERLGHLGRVGCALALIGSLIIVLHAPEDKPVETVDEILEYAVHPGFLLYVFTVLVVSLVMIYIVVPVYGRTNPTVYISICSLVGSVSVMSIKGFGVAVKLTFSGNNQFLRPSTYVFGVVTILCIVVQMNYYNKSLDTFSVNIVNPMYYVGFSSATIVASLILFQGFNTTDATNTISLIAGFVVIFLGVHILNLSRDSNAALELNGYTAPPAEDDFIPTHRTRGSLTGRLSIDEWHGIVEAPETPRTANGGRRYHSTTLFDGTEHVGLSQLREEDEETEDDDDDDDDDERTHLHKPQMPASNPQM
ncbi:magnesium transporter NIPA-domain-containing protein [Mucidula mucida]|nr:magnesium transporter NIPA-domain-containing protein [Mucidula mucida]